MHMNVTPKAIKSTLKGKLKPGKTAEYQVVRDATMKAGVNLRSRVSVQAYKAMAAFEELKKQKLLTAAAARSGKRTFLHAVQKTENTLKNKPSKAKGSLQQRLNEEDEQKRRIDEALNAGKGKQAAQKPADRRVEVRREMQTVAVAAAPPPPARGTPIRIPRAETAPTAPRAPSAPIPIRSREEVKEQEDEADTIDLPIAA